MRQVVAINHASLGSHYIRTVYKAQTQQGKSQKHLGTNYYINIRRDQVTFKNNNMQMSLSLSRSHRRWNGFGFNKGGCEKMKSNPITIRFYQV